MYANVVRAATVLVALLACQVLPVAAQSSLQFHAAPAAAAPSAPAATPVVTAPAAITPVPPWRQGVVQAGGPMVPPWRDRVVQASAFKLQGEDNTMPTVAPQPPEIETIGPGVQSSLPPGAVVHDGEIVCQEFDIDGVCAGCGAPVMYGSSVVCGSCGGCGTCGCNPCGCAPCGYGCAPCGCNPCGGCGPCDGCGSWGWGPLHCLAHICDNSQFFFAGDGWKDILDGDGNNNFGFRFGANFGVPVISCGGLGFQFGASYGVYDLNGHEFGNEDQSESEGMITFGFFRRCCLDCCNPWTWGLVYDRQLHQNVGQDAEDFVALGQFRFLLGYSLCECTEVGFWTAISAGDNDGDVRSMDQFNVYWRHYYESGADTSFFVGLAEQPGEFVLGFTGNAPLSDRVAMFGGVEYVCPSAGAGNPGFSEESWNVSFGFAFYPHCNACSNSICGRTWMPVLPVADNGSFILRGRNHND